ncbi:MAG: ribonuclease H-like YkuK family protein [Candidatus Paceibacterales bacterium]
MMKNFLDGNFFNPSRGNLKLNQVIDEVLSYITEKPEKFYDIIVGCDSSSGQEPHFPVAVVILRKGEGGRFFLKKIGYKNRKFYNWHQRVLEEVLLSCQLALFLREDLNKKIEGCDSSNSLNYQFRYIHADIGENGQTKDMIKEVTGLIRGNGFEPKIKPEAYVASTVADRYA